MSAVSYARTRLRRAKPRVVEHRARGFRLLGLQRGEGGKDVREVERIMADRQVRRVPVVDDANCCVGMVAQADLARDERGFSDREVRDTIERISEPNGRA